MRRGLAGTAGLASNAVISFSSCLIVVAIGGQWLKEDGGVVLPDLEM